MVTAQAGTLQSEVLIFGAILALAPLLMLVASYMMVRNPELRKKLTFSDRVGMANLSIAILAIVLTLYVFVQEISSQNTAAQALLDAQGALRATADRLNVEEASLASLQRQASAHVREINAENTALKRAVSDAQDELDVFKAQNAALNAALATLRSASPRDKGHGASGINR